MRIIRTCILSLLLASTTVAAETYPNITLTRDTNKQLVYFKATPAKPPGATVQYGYFDFYSDGYFTNSHSHLIVGMRGQTSNSPYVPYTLLGASGRAAVIGAFWYTDQSPDCRNSPHNQGVEFYSMRLENLNRGTPLLGACAPTASLQNNVQYRFLWQATDTYTATWIENSSGQTIPGTFSETNWAGESYTDASDVFIIDADVQETSNDWSLYLTNIVAGWF